ncbi:adenylate cyclase type 10-like [Leptopilina heterotoma]|uniref:adenylate cyclase type 10-like n=1 Tax=Leptopilina heterotoma TaxID=63436 RepID=UPI001CA8E0DD|nr:adenylate cyclase type 10-like [Leptopilina heterotoma]
MGKFTFYDSLIVTESNQNSDRRSRRLLHGLKIKKHTTIFASMCPDEILDYYDDYETRTYFTTLMLGDVSGFTDLTEKYTKFGKGGPSKLTEILNTYIGSMVQEILSRRGDVLKFSGDALIVMWKLQEGMSMQDIAVEAMQTACVIQKHFGTFETDVGVTLKVKLAIASGKTSFTSIGNAKLSSYYIITGKPVWDVKYAETLCRGGDIIVAPSCWKWANTADYIYTKLPDGIHILILACPVLYESGSKQEFEDTTASESEHEEYLRRVDSQRFEYNSDFISRYMSIDSQYLTPLDQIDYRLFNFKQFNIFQVRPKLIKVTKDCLKNALSSYIPRPVVRSVELDEPMEYLTEMRQVVIVFVNVITKNANKMRLIRLVNHTYTLVCEIVSEMQGCVNKTSLFDKDLMFLCIFGLRGDKHELESQIGLRCASKIRQSLIELRNIESVSVGVTTGITYCGVVGHILRREYTVIGMAVNKAARLMCAYTDKVVCDRDSFLHSHLEAKHFVLQEVKQLKGITNIGPVYEFLEQAQESGSRFIPSKYPLLGRDDELKVFEKLLQNLLQSHNERSQNKSTRLNKSVLIIRGVSRIGKTRLMNEFTQLVPTNTSFNFISLGSNDSKIPFRLVYLIFSAPLGITENSSVKDRTSKLLHNLMNFQEPEYLCVLNEPFKVDFKISTEYGELERKEKQRFLRKVLVILMYTCFEKLSVIFIDDIEYADRESISLLNTLMKLDLILFVIGSGQKNTNTYSFHKDVIERTQVQNTIDLLGVKRWFHTGLACQFLNCQAIPAELEKTIQQKSLGNPGWIESYLISLKQSDGLCIKSVSKTEVIKMGLVFPPKEMLIRQILEDATIPIIMHKNKMNPWKMYGSSFKESDLEVEKKKLEIDNEKLITVCVLTEKFVTEDLGTEVTIDVIILKLFDSLSPLDQLLLKCAAVLGETIDRKMMESLMQGIAQKEIANTVAKLFEMRLLGCAVGDFNRSPGPLIFFKTLQGSIFDIEIRCGCSGFEIDESLADFPKYASCRLMRFKMTLLRETTYKLLTENQKVEFHSKALKYLQRTTRRCVSCGEGRFAKLLGTTTVEETIPRDTLDVIDHLLETQSYSRSSSKALHDNTKRRSTMTKKLATSCLTICKSVEKVPTRTFSQMDFSNCQCNMILLTVYSQMVDHCQGMGMKSKLLSAILEFTVVCISTCNIPQARKLVNEGELILEQMNGTIKDDLITLPFLKGKIYTLQGRCFLESGLLTEAENCFNLAAKTMGYYFPKSQIMIKIKMSVMLKKLKRMLTWLRPCKVGILDGIAADYVDQFAHCLAQMFTIFRLKGMFIHAHLAAIWGLIVALESSKDFLVLCTAYANMMVTANYIDLGNIISHLENDGLRICSQRKDALELQELKAVGELYSGIFSSRWLRGMTLKSCNLGFIGNRIASTVRSTVLQLTILPRLIHVMLVTCRTDEAIYLLNEMEMISNIDMDKSGKTWYYALCVDVLLETSISVIPFYKCEQFFQEESDTMLNLRDAEAERRFFTCMWLWYVRGGDWEIATVWKNRRVANTEVVMDGHTISSAITILKRVEGLLILYGKFLTI